MSSNNTNYSTAKRAALYVRVSTQEQMRHGISIDSQIAALTQYCEANGLTPYKVYNDAGISGRKSYKHRPALLQMLKDCQDRKIDVLLVTKLDRFFRSVPDYYACMEQMNGVPWRAIWEDYETETSSGMFKVNIMLSIAQAESDRTAERIKAVNQYRRDTGRYVGSAPIGYKIENGQLVIDEDRREAVTALFTAYADYKSIAECIRAARNKGLAISRQKAQYILSNPTYRGTTKSGYKCEALISKDIDEKIRARRLAPTRSGYHRRIYLFNGILYCSKCGARMQSRTEIVRRNDTRHHAQYRCSTAYNDCSKSRCTGCCINESIVEEIVLNQIEEQLRAHNAEIRAQRRAAARTDTGKQKTRLEAKLQRVCDLYEDGMIERDEYRAKTAAINAQIAAIREQDDLTEVRMPEHWRDVYNDLSQEQRAAFWHRCIKKIVVYPFEGGAAAEKNSRRIDIYF